MKTGYLFVMFFLAAVSFHATAQSAKDFFDPARISEIRIQFTQKDWQSQLDSLRATGDDMLVASALIDSMKYENVGIGYRSTGAYKVGSKRNPMQIRLNLINRNQNHQGNKTLLLSTAVRDPSMIREVLTNEIARTYMPAPRANYARLYINGEYNGLYVSMENIDEAFLEKYFGGSEGSFFRTVSAPREQADGCKKSAYGSLMLEDQAGCYMNNFKMLSKDGWDDLIELARVLNKDPDNIEKVLNVDRTLWMLAFNNAIVNLSSYSGEKSYNFFLYRDKLGQFNPIVSDLNFAFASFKNTGVGSDLNLQQLQNLDPLLHLNNSQKPLISQLLKHPTYQKSYLAHLRTIIMDYFENERYEKRAKELQSLIQKDFEADPNKSYTVEDLKKSMSATIGEKSKIPGISELMDKRSRFIKKHSLMQAIPPAVKESKVARREKFTTNIITKFHLTANIDGFPQKVRLFYRFKPSEAYQEAVMTDDGQKEKGDAVAGDKVFSVIVDPAGKSDRLEYYIMVENAAAVSFDPPAYMFRPNTVTLTDLNK